MPVGQPHAALLVTDRAVGTDQGLKYLYVVDKDNKVRYQRVTLGALQDDGLRVITDGLKADDWVIVTGLQMARPGMTVSPDRQPMPIPAQEAAVHPLESTQPTTPAVNPDKPGDAQSHTNSGGQHPPNKSTPAPVVAPTPQPVLPETDPTPAPPGPVAPVSPPAKSDKP